MAERAWQGGTESDLGWASSTIWKRLEAMRIEPEGAQFTFTARLARGNGWSIAYAEQVFFEYKRFLYLAAHGEEPVTPSDEVDQAWHLHLAYSRHYWDVLCGDILKRPLHHGPTEGGDAARDRYRRQYKATLRLYRSTFGTEPCPDIWPPPVIRFSGRPVRVDLSRHWLVPKDKVRIPATAAAGGLLLAACNSLSGEGSGVWLAVLAAIVCGAVLSKLVMRAEASRERARIRARSGKRERDGGGDGGSVATGDGGGNPDCPSDGGGGGDGGGGCGGGCGS